MLISGAFTLHEGQSRRYKHRKLCNHRSNNRHRSSLRRRLRKQSLTTDAMTAAAGNKRTTARYTGLSSALVHDVDSFLQHMEHWQGCHPVQYSMSASASACQGPATPATRQLYLHHHTLIGWRCSGGQRINPSRRWVGCQTSGIVTVACCSNATFWQASYFQK